MEHGKWLQEISDIKTRFDELARAYEARYHYEEWPGDKGSYMVRVDATFKIRKEDK